MISAEVVTAVSEALTNAYPDLLVRDVENPDETKLPARSSTDVWVALEFPPSEEYAADEGDPDNIRWREEGVFMVHVYVPTGTGPDTAKLWARRVYEVYRGKVIGDDVECFGRDRGDMGERWNGNWWGISFAMPFRRDHI